MESMDGDSSRRPVVFHLTWNAQRMMMTSIFFGSSFEVLVHTCKYDSVVYVHSVDLYIRHSSTRS